MVKIPPGVQTFLKPMPQKDTLLLRLAHAVRARVENNPKVKRVRSLAHIEQRIQMWEAVAAEPGNTNLVKASALGRVDELKKLRARLA